MIEVECKNCGKKVLKHEYRLRVYKNLFCSRVCKHQGHIGYKHSEDAKEKIAKASKGRSFTGWKQSEKAKERLRELAKNNPNLKKFEKEHTPWNKGKIWEQMRGENHPQWIKDRTQLKRDEDTIKDRRSSAYAGWRLQVWTRDGFKCRIENIDCNGRIEAHHILGWTKYVELRYEINNGITLCHFHHPKKRDEEKRLIPFFTSMVEVIKN